jgi:hypothetical protein
MITGITKAKDQCSWHETRICELESALRDLINELAHLTEKIEHVKTDLLISIDKTKHTRAFWERVIFVIFTALTGAGIGLLVKWLFTE